jgi:Fe-S-cluster-containing hydrogenase component 2
MRAAEIDFGKCAVSGCYNCAAAKVCPTRAIGKLDPDEPAWVDQAACNGCGDCVGACLRSAIKVTQS